MPEQKARNSMNLKQISIALYDTLNDTSLTAP
jgi:hypothetical protein